MLILERSIDCLKKHEIKINLPGLLKMLGSNIYSKPDVAIREMIQNAQDTCIIRKTKDKEYNAPAIYVSYNTKKKTLTFSDNGCGMTEQELHQYLSTIGDGFTKLQKQVLRNVGIKEALLLIGQFGIGLLSAFSVAKKVEVFTCSYRPDSTGFRWSCEGDIEYEVEPIDHSEIGTTVELHLTDNNLILLNDKTLQRAIKKYADFLSIPIYLKGNQINSCSTPWNDKVEYTDLLDYVHMRYDLNAISIIPFQVKNPLNMDGLLFVPTVPLELLRDFGEIDIYVSHMFVKENDRELLPHWARFVKGLVNSPDLTPTVSRDDIIRDDNYYIIRKLLGELILDSLMKLEKHAPDELEMVVKTYNNTIKAKSLDDDSFFKRICDLVRVSTDVGHLSMKDYLNKSQNVIYYFCEQGTEVQNKLLFGFKGLPVIDSSWGLEEIFLEKYATHKGLQSKRLESDSELIFTVIESADQKWKDLEKQFKSTVHIEARAVAFDPATIPAVLVCKPMKKSTKGIEKGTDVSVSNSSTGTFQVRKMFEKINERKMARRYGDGSILQLNTLSPLMQKLCDMNRNETFRLALRAILNNAVMLAQDHISPEEVEIFFATNNDVVSAMIGHTLAFDEIQQKITKIELSKQRSCFFAYPFQEKFHALQRYIRKFLVQNYGINLMTTAIEIKNASVIEDIKNQIAESHFGIADISGNNPNVLWELGLMIGYGKPVLILKEKSDISDTPFDLYGNYRVEYQIIRDDSTGNVEYPLLTSGLERNLKRIFIECPQLEKADKWTKNIE